MNDYSPWGRLSEMPHVIVKIGQLPEGLLGFWDPDAQVIALDNRQSQRQMRCTLAHELEHVAHGDESVESIGPVLAARQEIAACVRAARKLIPLKELLRALLCSVEQDERELAEELHVDLDTLRMRLLTLTPKEHGILDRVLLAEQGIA